MSRQQIADIPTPIGPDSPPAEQEKLAPALHYLQRFGYLQEFPAPGALDLPTQEALRILQLNFGIPVTAIFDSSTKEAMQKQRCGVKDFFLLSSVSPPDVPLICGWKHAEITYWLGSGPVGITPQEIATVIAGACFTWNLALQGLNASHRLVRAASAQSARIEIFWISAGVASSVDVDDVAAAGFPPDCVSPPGSQRPTIHLNRGDESGIGWVVAPASTSSLSTDSWDIESVVLHELGHILGIQHSDAGAHCSAVMYPWFECGRIRRELTGWDREALKKALARYPPIQA